MPDPHAPSTLPVQGLHKEPLVAFCQSSRQARDRPIESCLRPLIHLISPDRHRRILRFYSIIGGRWAMPRSWKSGTVDSQRVLFSPPDLLLSGMRSKNPRFHNIKKVAGGRNPAQNYLNRSTIIGPYFLS